jgi:opacity protein-like surface antigen
MLRRVSTPVRATAFALLAGLFTFSTTTPADAQEPPFSWTGLYVGLHGGINIPRDTRSEFDSPGLPGGVGFITTDADNGYRFGGALGYTFTRHLSAEIELSYTRNSLDTLDVVSIAFPAGSGPLAAKGSASTLSGMVNGYFSLPMDRFRPYVGAGIGVTRVSAHGAGFAGVPGETDDSDTAFTWQLMAGVGFQLSPNLELGARYRFQHVNSYTLINSGGDEQRVDGSEGHSFEVTLKFAFPK